MFMRIIIRLQLILGLFFLCLVQISSPVFLRICRILRRPKFAASGETKRQSIPVASYIPDPAENRRSWVIDQKSAFKLPSPYSLDDTACAARVSAPLFSLPSL